MTDRNVTNRISDVAQSVVVPSSRVFRSMEVAHIGARTAHHHDESPTIELVTEDNVVRAIDITCGCGQKMRLWCSYETEAGE